LSETDNCLPKTREIFEKGEFDRRKYVFIYTLPSDTTMIGFFVNKRCGNAVKRNKIKRWMREIYRQNKSHFEGRKVIIYTKRPIIYSYQELANDILEKPIS
jgi:ribonuclease P protein component